MSGSYYALNSKINNLQAEINALQGTVGPLPPLTNIVTTDTVQTITATKTFSTLPKSSVAPTTGNDLVNKTYVDGRPVPDLQAVLNVGNSANENIRLNNGGTNRVGLYAVNGVDPYIEVSDGTTTNTINKNGYTTRNTNANATHFLNFVDSSTTATGAIQQTTGITCNPSTKTITATTFVGALTGTATNSTNSNVVDENGAGTFYPTLVGAVGNSPLKIDSTTGPLSYVPSTGTLSASIFSGSLSGTATNSTNAVIGTDNASTTVYPAFVKTSGSGNKGLFIDDTTTPLTYNPSTGALSSTSFAGALTGSTVSASGLISANGGLTMGSATVIRYVTPPTISYSFGTLTQSILNATDTIINFPTANARNGTATGIGYSAGTFTNNNAYSVTLNVSASVAFASNASGFRVLVINTASQGRLGMNDTVNNGAGEASVLSTSSTFVLNAGETFTILGYQTSGGALNVGGSTLTVSRVSVLVM